MKKLYLLSLSALILLCSCKGKNTEKDTSEKGASVVSKKANIIKKPLYITADFNQITSLGGIDIIYTQGDYNIEAEGDSVILNCIEVSTDSGILTLNLTTDRNKDLNVYEGKQNIKVHISSPDLKCVALCSSGDFKSKGMWENENIELGVIGSGGFELDSVKCNNFKYEATGDGDTRINNLESKDNIYITCMGASNVTTNLNANIINVATQSGIVTLTGKVSKKELAATKPELIIDKTNDK